MQPEYAAQLADTSLTLTGQVSNDSMKALPVVGEGGEELACRPMLCECPLGCGHAHVEHPHLNMMHE